MSFFFQTKGQNVNDLKVPSPENAQDAPSTSSVKPDVSSFQTQISQKFVDVYSSVHTIVSNRLFLQHMVLVARIYMNCCSFSS